MLLSQSGAEATILTSLTRSWKMIANQTDRYIAIKNKEAQKKHGRPAGPVSLRRPAAPVRRLLRK
jgi:hypothetical protein